ncbi:LysR substrate-binding domain-containing protein [Sphingomonas jatrophae]|uniref:LysR family transcriptional regulator, glycine cleavage system transcriptional activator n=1 Tax=Sphingomonas jatrophae TaxID=1166337 RepID=A0A1I6K2S3_9SPHN|nr:LysR substrate-binding domain-containing protein [Sphingomonas jatrophae]SFR85542.1 LysR family transcriptional regulator, glycine cleavage system transcriptional activator [Sphingomonas jatrophae]
MRRLPPLTAVEAFVQVARLGSVKAAAEELALSSPALSRRIQALERFVGRPLFERRHQAMALNPAGEALLARLAPALGQLAEAMEAATAEGDVLRLKLAVPPLFASQRLIGRLPELRQRYPELHIDMDTSAHPLSRLGEGLDAAIVLARDVEPPLYGRLIQRGLVVPIVARSVAERTHAGFDALSSLTVLLHRDMPQTFDLWREAVGAPGVEPAAVDYFDSGQLMLEAAAQGLGVAFMLDLHLELAQDDRLVRLFDVPVESNYAYWFACRRGALASRAVRLFHDWLFAAE